MPASLDLILIQSGAPRVAGNTVVTVMAHHFLLQLFLLFLERQMPILANPFRDLQDSPSQSALVRFLPDHPVTVPGLAPMMKKAKERKAPLLLTADFAHLVTTLRLAHINELRFLRMYRQAIFGEPFR